MSDYERYSNYTNEELAKVSFKGSKARTAGMNHAFYRVLDDRGIFEPDLRREFSHLYNSN